MVVENTNTFHIYLIASDKIQVMVWYTNITQFPLPTKVEGLNHKLIEKSISLWAQHTLKTITI